MSFHQKFQTIPKASSIYAAPASRQDYFHGQGQGINSQPGSTSENRAVQQKENPNPQPGGGPPTHTAQAASITEIVGKLMHLLTTSKRERLIGAELAFDRDNIGDVAKEVVLTQYLTTIEAVKCHSQAAELQEAHATAVISASVCLRNQGVLAKHHIIKVWHRLRFRNLPMMKTTKSIRDSVKQEAETSQ
ncbi:hypothetical protein B0H34DRAFT_673079 [Crassisporium funariophilum]|nr:hypothetical protein B0H34DRAFT_673079 [Crassisporium funariophilum]